MWTRSLLKDNAKSVLKRTYWRSFLVCLVMGFLAGGGTTAATANSARDADYNYDAAYSYSDGVDSLLNSAVLGIIAVVVCIFAVLGIVYAVFVANPIRVGGTRYFMEARGGNAPFGSLFSVFGKPGYGNVAKSMFLMDLFVFLWSLLLIVPGIIKSYEYYFVPYLLAERPDMDAARARELSRQMTDGEKWNIFVLNLSFFGWMLLGALACGVGTLFVPPYIHATDAELYTALRTKAISEGKTNEQELPGFIAYP